MAALAAVVAGLCLSACAASSPGANSAGRGPAGQRAVAPSGQPRAELGLSTRQPTAGRSPGTAPRSANCTDPAFTTSEHLGGWNTRGYFVHNDMWNDSLPLGPQTLYACAYNNWYVVSDQTDNGGAVKTYPNVHKDYNNAAISSFTSLTSMFAATGPQAGIYNVAFDIWTNGIATSGSTEIMIWTDNFHQAPAGTRTKTVTFSGRTYDVFRTASGDYLAFVAKSSLRSGTINVLEFLKWTIAQGYLAANSTLGQICYGVEIVSTAGRSRTFSFTDFSLSSG